jgi:Na+/alanine symporter
MDYVFVHPWAVSNAAQNISVAGVGIYVYIICTRTKSIVLIAKSYPTLGLSTSTEATPAARATRVPV